MTLYDETLEDRFKIQKKNNKKFTELDIMMLYKRAIDILDYIHGKRIVHNAIDTQNIFLLGPNVYIGSKHFLKFVQWLHEQNIFIIIICYFALDFDLATLNDEGHTHATADFESLIYSLWSVAGMNEPKGLNLAGLANIEEAAVHAQVKAKCAYFVAESVRKAFELTICFEMLSKKAIPQHHPINMVLQLTIVGLKGNSNEAKFSWLPKKVLGWKFSRIKSQLASSSRK